MKPYTKTIQQATVTALLLLFFTSMFFSFSSCIKIDSNEEGPCKHGDTPVHLITSLDKSRINMYTGNDKLTFINTTTQQEQVYESKAVETYFVAYTNSNIDERCKFYKKQECKKIVFYTGNSSDKITVLIDYIPKSHYQHLYIHFKQNGYDENIGHFKTNNDIDSVIIQNKVYYNIYKITTFQEDPNFDKWYVYYTLNEGIIRVKLINGEIWDLKDKQ